MRLIFSRYFSYHDGRSISRNVTSLNLRWLIFLFFPTSPHLLFRHLRVLVNDVISLYSVAYNLNDIKHYEPWSWRHLENEFQFKIISLLTAIKFYLWYITMLLYSQLFFSFRKFVTVFLFVARDKCPFYSFFFSILTRNNSFNSSFHKSTFFRHWVL